MVVKHEVHHYRVAFISGYSECADNQIAFIYLEDKSDKYIGYIGIIKDGKTLPDNVQWPNGVLNIYFHETEFVPLLDLFRNVRGYVKVYFDTDLKWGWVGPYFEPVAGQEVPSYS